jgi:photosystem II stability/assembly factor-like uncharacterized protein
MRIGFVLVLSAITAATAHAQEWTVIPLGTSADLQAIEKTSFSSRYLVGDGGFVAHSDATQFIWTPVSTGTTADLLAVHQPASGQAWVSGDAGVVRRLISGTWESRNIPNASEDFVIFSRSSGWSYAGGTGGSLYRTTDGGTSWNLQSSGTTNAIRDGSGFVSSTAIAVGDGGTIVKTSNGGLDWFAKPSGTTENLYAYKDAGGGAILVAGANGTMLRSTDAGETWATIPIGTTESIHDIDTSGQNGNWVLAVGTGGTIRRSTDAGSTWCAIDAETSVDLYATDMVLNAKFVVAGAGGYLAVSETAGGGCFDPTDVVGPAAVASFRLTGPWPQPMTRAGHFELAVDRSQQVRADLIDVTGRRVRSLLDERVEPGTRRTVAFELERHPAGVYFLRVEGSTDSVTRRIVLVR